MTSLLRLGQVEANDYWRVEVYERFYAGVTIRAPAYSSVLHLVAAGATCQ